MSKPHPPLMTDALDFIRGASEPPKPTVVGGRAGEIAKELPKAEPAPPAPAPKAPPASKHESESFPWESANPKVRQFVQVRMPEPLNLKLRWIKENTLGINSVHDLILTTLEEMADKEIKEILKYRQGRVGRSK